MGVIDEEGDGGTVSRGGRVEIIVDSLCAILLLAHVLVELDEMERLILDVGEQVVVADEVEDARTAEFEIVRECFPRLTIEDEAERSRQYVFFASNTGRTARRHSP